MVRKWLKRYQSKNVPLGIHEQVIEEDDDSEPAIRSPDQVQFAVTHITERHFGQRPETIHGKAFHLMRLIAGNHWFVDGNKRTALNTTVLFYYANIPEEEQEDYQTLRDILHDG